MADSSVVTPEELSGALERHIGRRGVEVRETHISWVFLLADRAFKLKKPVVLPFVDYGTPARRAEMCRAEVTLNRRLAHDVYLDVRGVIRVDGALQITADADGALDYVVEMRRYDEGATLASLLDRGELRLQDVERVAQRIADFHASCPALENQQGRVAAEVQRNLDELADVAELHSEQDRVRELSRLLRSFMRSHAAELQHRAGAGFTRECHGDLRAQHVLLGSEVLIVDCVEFDRELRTLDVADDLAFLAMDLTSLGGERFTNQLIASYREAGGDCGTDQLLSFYGVHRALIRAKVLLIRAAQAPAISATHGHASVLARELLGVAELFGWRTRLPVAIVVCGVPASGKSHLAAELAALSRLPRVNSDLVRKRLAGLAATTRAGRAQYRDEVSRATYRELGLRAAAEIAQHGGVFVDATFRHRADREAFTSAFAAAAPVLFLQCHAPDHVLIQRALQRERDPRRVSDASAEVVMRERRSFEPLEEVRSEDRVELATDRPVSEIVADVLRWLDDRA